MNDPLKYLLSCQTRDGAIAEHPGGRPFPEVTGYSIPTLIVAGYQAAAEACAQWLIDNQKTDGAYVGMDQIKHTFDTSACIEGLGKFHDRKAREARRDAYNWMMNQFGPKGLRVHPGTERSELYGVRALAILGGQKHAAERWTSYPDGWGWAWGDRQRFHYVAYAMEGFWRMGLTAPVHSFVGRYEAWFQKSRLLPYWLNKDGTAHGPAPCVSATAQFAMLLKWMGLHDHANLLLDAARKPDLNRSWEAKWLLDAMMS